MKTVSIIGVGRVGGALSLALPHEKYVVEHLVARGSLHDLVEKELGSKRCEINDIDRLASEIVFITTRDGEIAGVAQDLRGKVGKAQSIFHTSGAQSSAILASLKEAGCTVGSIHPLVSISGPELGPGQFRGSYFCVEGDDEAVSLGNSIVDDLGGKPFTVGTEFKTLYHAAAVTACGHLVALFDAAVEMMTKTGLSEDRSKGILLPLVASTVRNLERQSSADALTGTFARADTDTFTRHITALNQHATDELLEIYLLLGERSLELAAKQGVSAERIEKLRTKVAVAKSKLKW